MNATGIAHCFPPCPSLPTLLLGPTFAPITPMQCVDHNSCGGPFVWRSTKLFEDWTLTNLYGARLVEAIHKRFHVSTLHGMSADIHHKR